MGENVKVDEQSPERIREQIRHTESDITHTVQTLEQRLSPRYLKRQGMRKAKLFAWQGIAKALDLAQRTSVQVSLVGGGALLMLLGSRRVRERVTVRTARKPAIEVHPGAAVARAAGASALWLLMRRFGGGKVSAESTPVSGWALAATAAKAFLGGKRASEKGGTPREGGKVAWRGLATSLGAALGSYWYTHKTRRV
ncbi:DUF3618 domain-containing protein [Geomonas sp. Red69]|uniref:DUF3618 domain-containing protein n=1 Tax=Geomonas diazotrophica TaxID=2843197 RepID=A0ABX8JG83_9BACT|nr:MULTISPECIES: DUF3618 domain-containing protein [Geomonas]MBU5636257.1 DUF3618 domain-containing protein [Geomonas diazotrophica]QWV96151.1 DUF3618 domain-containing protein [Geomonas nitrogeniifigens]QXE85218.1 DUF3618 domain-containing protein [Geomonas nitrogeniifigens]